MGLFSFLFGLAGDAASASGYAAESKAYSTAATYAKQNAVIARESGAIKLAQTNRDIYKVLGQQQAAYGGGGLESSGTALDVRRASVEQGALQRAIVQEQTQINVTGYQEQAAQFQGLASQAQANEAGSIIKGIGDALSIIPGF